MRPFNLEEAKAGKALITRNGRKARVVCWNMQSSYDGPKLIGLVEEKGGELLVYYHMSGHCVDENYPSREDLFMASEKKEGWVNVYRRGNGELVVGAEVFITEEAALTVVDCWRSWEKVVTAKVQWEE